MIDILSLTDKNGKKVFDLTSELSVSVQAAS